MRSVSELLAWQWEGYARYHQSRTNLLLHIVLVPPVPFSDTANALGRIFLEQWITFPRFVLTGAWLRELRRSQVVRHQ